MATEVIEGLVARIREGEQAIAEARARRWTVPAWETELNTLRLALSQQAAEVLAWAWETVEFSADYELLSRCRALLVELALDSYRDIEVLGSPAMVRLAHLRDGHAPYGSQV